MSEAILGTFWVSRNPFSCHSNKYSNQENPVRMNLSPHPFFDLDKNLNDFSPQLNPLKTMDGLESF